LHLSKDFGKKYTIAGSHKTKIAPPSCLPGIFSCCLMTLATKEGFVATI